MKKRVTLRLVDDQCSNTMMRSTNDYGIIADESITSSLLNKNGLRAWLEKMRMAILPAG